MIGTVQQSDLGSQSLECLGQLTADRPSPMTARRAGRSVKEKAVSLVMYPASASP